MHWQQLTTHILLEIDGAGLVHTMMAYIYTTFPIHQMQLFMGILILILNMGQTIPILPTQVIEGIGVLTPTCLVKSLSHVICKWHIYFRW